MRQPKVSDLVHYYISDEPRAAIVAEVREDNICSLAIFYPNSISFAAYCAYSLNRTPGSWCFPEDSEMKIGELSYFPESESTEDAKPVPQPLTPTPF